MIDIKKILQDFHEEYNVGDEKNLDYTKLITTGIVVDTDDPLQMGRLRVFCPALNDDPKKLHHLSWAVYVPPFGGVINNPAYARGTGKYPESTEGSVAYGFWGIPEQGSKVIVACIDGDERRRVWLGCLPEHQETHTMLHGRFKWDSEDGEPDGPLSSNGNPIEPAYTNASTAFQGDKKSREWKTRQAEYQVSALSPEDDDPNSSKSGYTDELQPQIAKNETDDWVKPILGAHGYDWSGNKALGEYLSSRVFGLNTPGGHVISLDDRAFNSRIRIKSATGHQLIFDDTNERIYLSTNEGANWIEFDSNGNIDIYSKRRISVHAEKDINFSTDETFRVKAKKGIHMYAGDTTGQTPLENVPADGQIRLHSTDDFHVYTEKNFRQLIDSDMLTEVKGNVNIQTEGTWTHHSDGNIAHSTDANLTIQSASNSQVQLTPATIGINSANVIVDADINTLVQGGSNRISVGPAINNFYSGSFNYIQDAGGAITTTPTILNTVITSCCGTPPLQPGPIPPVIPLTPETIVTFESETEFSIWTNRVPQHEPWPRVLKQDSDDEVNEENEGYKNNVDWIDQFDNETPPEGLEPIGKVEGDETIERGPLWRR